MSMIAQLAVAAAVYAIDRPYSYRVPEDMPLLAGMRVLVPFGHGNRRTEGVVLSVQEGDPSGLKAVERTLDGAPILTDSQLRLAAFMKERYFCTFYDAVKAHPSCRILVRRKADADARIRRAGQAAARHGKLRRGKARTAADRSRRQCAGADAPAAV